MNDLLIKVLITVMAIDAGMHFYYAYKKNVYQSLRFLTLTGMQAIRQKKKEDKDKYYSTTKGKFYKRNLMKQKGGRKIW